MLDAASAVLSGSIRAAFDAHLHDCAACRDEFRRIQTLVQEIDRTLSVSLTAEPSAQLVATVRQSIVAQRHGAAAWGRWGACASAAGVCAALAILLFIARTTRKFNPPVHNSAAVQTSASPILKPAMHPRLNAETDVALTQPRKPALASIRHASLHTYHRIAEPEIIVEPGQMQAIFQLVAATQEREVSGSNLFMSEKQADEPIKIQPIKIDPLKISASTNDP